MRPEPREEVGSVAMQRHAPQASDAARDPFAAPFAGPPPAAPTARALYVLPPPLSPRQPVQAARGAEPAPAMMLSYSRAAHRALPREDPESPTPKGRRMSGVFVPFARLPVMELTQAAWAESCCSIMQEPINSLAEPVVVPVHEVLHVFEYAHLKRWLRESGHVRGTPPQFRNPMNAVWTPLTSLHQARPQQAPCSSRAVPAAPAARPQEPS